MSKPYKSAVYFIQKESGGPIKIGFTRDVRKRLGQLQNAHVEPLRAIAAFKGYIESEKRILNDFKHLRIKGEWHEDHEEIHELIAQLKSGNQRLWAKYDLEGVLDNPLI